MRIINRSELDRCKQKHANSRKPLTAWESIVSKTDYQDLNDLKKVFGKKVDYLSKGYTVFDIGGNNYRLVTIIDYLCNLIEIIVVWTHSEYSNPKNAKNLRDGDI